jgi:hypothetical protein
MRASIAAFRVQLPVKGALSPACLRTAVLGGVAALSLGACATVDMTDGATPPPPPPPSAAEATKLSLIAERRAELASASTLLCEIANASGWAPGADNDMADFTRTLAEGRTIDGRGPIEIYLSLKSDDPALAATQILADARDATERALTVANAADATLAVSEGLTRSRSDVEKVERALIALKRGRNTFEGATAQLYPDPMTSPRFALGSQLTALNVQIQRLDDLADRMMAAEDAMAFGATG